VHQALGGGLVGAALWLVNRTRPQAETAVVMVDDATHDPAGR
jgi:hypothetical protein